MSALPGPDRDPTPIFELFRGSYGTELLTAAVEHLHLFQILADEPLTPEALRIRLDLAPRAFVVLMTAMRAMKLVEVDSAGRMQLSPLAREHLVPGGEFYVGDYVGLAGSSPGVLEMVKRLRTNDQGRAAESDPGAAFIFREGLKSAMESEMSARRLTLALAGRAKNVAPTLADHIPFGNETLLDVGGGTGIYSIACLRKHPGLKAIVFDRPEVLKVAAEFAVHYGVADRLECHAGDMFTDPLPPADAILLSNVLHDWDVPECQRLVDRCAAALPANGRLLIHDVFLNDELDGPLPVALYSASLFSLTEGRAYSGREYREWLTTAGLTPSQILPTLVHCGVLTGTK
ncbi:MAG: methyltransferase domain-containing protein [Planctomycetes bacterium]|nr:methyltransferase domain-containing protein [Planctomycetota bacterium]